MYLYQIIPVYLKLERKIRKLYLLIKSLAQLHKEVLIAILSLAVQLHHMPSALAYMARIVGFIKETREKKHLSTQFYGILNYYEYTIYCALGTNLLKLYTQTQRPECPP